MNATHFPEANTRHRAPEGLDESHVKTIPSFRAQIHDGPHDGAEMIVVAWRPSPDDLKKLNEGGFIYLSMMGGLCPHFLSTEFKEVTCI